MKLRVGYSIHTEIIINIMHGEDALAECAHYMYSCTEEQGIRGRLVHVQALKSGFGKKGQEKLARM